MTEETPDYEPTRRDWIGYWSMIVQQTQNAFNDKMAQFILIPLAAAVAMQLPLPGGKEIAVESAAGLIIALPFVLFAPIAGWFSDRFSKRDVMIACAILQLIVLLWITGALWMRDLPLAMFGFFMLAVQSAFFSPAKIGINKELVGTRHLGFATSMQQMLTMLAILVGQIVAGWLFDIRYQNLGGTEDSAWKAAMEPMVVLTVLAVPAVILAWIIPRVPAQGGVPFTAGLAVHHFMHLAELWRNPPLRHGAFGVAFFWGFAAFINLWSVKLAKEITGGGEGFGTLSSIFMASASLGMIAGFGLASFMLRKRIELGWVPLAAIAMAISAVALAYCPLGSAVSYLRILETDPVSFVFSSPREVLFLLILGVLAFSSAIFLAPLNAWMQDRYPADKRGELQAAVNLQDCFGGMLVVLMIAGFEAYSRWLGMSPLEGFRAQMIFVSVSCLLAAVSIIRMLPADFIRVIGIGMIRMIYRIRAVHPERLPTKGGVLLLPNHVTFADAFFISAASPRPVRFVMDGAFTANKAVRLFTGIFDTVNIRRDQSLEAIRIVIRALKEGHVVCLFPEGQLTRTGGLCTLQRGFELIARKAGHPLFPMWCDGSWGSIFSFEGNRFFRKIPRDLKNGITVAFGQEVDPGHADLEALRDRMLATSSEAVAGSFAGRVWFKRLTRGDSPADKAFLATDKHTRRRLWINGHQIGMVNALPRRQTLHLLSSDLETLGLTSITAVFPELFKGSICLHENFDGDHDGVWIGGDLLRHEIHYSQITARQIDFYDFGADALKPVERAGLCHCPCLALDGVVVAMSMRHPEQPPAGLDPQLGRKPRSWGKLLPGWHIEKDVDGGQLLVKGPAAPQQGLLLPAGSKLDEECFILS